MLADAAEYTFTSDGLTTPASLSWVVSLKKMDVLFSERKSLWPKAAAQWVQKDALLLKWSKEESIRGLFAIHTIPTAKHNTECPRDALGWEPGAWGAVPFVEVLSLSGPATGGSPAGASLS